MGLLIRISLLIFYPYYCVTQFKSSNAWWWIEVSQGEMLTHKKWSNPIVFFNREKISIGIVHFITILPRTHYWINWYIKNYPIEAVRTKFEIHYKGKSLGFWIESPWLKHNFSYEANFCCCSLPIPQHSVIYRIEKCMRSLIQKTTTDDSAHHDYNSSQLCSLDSFLCLQHSSGLLASVIA